MKNHLDNIYNQIILFKNIIKILNFILVFSNTLSNKQTNKKKLYKSKEVNNCYIYVHVAKRES